MDWPNETRFRRDEGVRIIEDPDHGAFVRFGRSYAHLAAGSALSLMEALAEARSLASLLSPAQAALSNATLRWHLRQLVDAGYVRVEAPGQDAEASPAPSTEPTGDDHPGAAHDMLERSLQRALERAGVAGLQVVSLDHHLGARGLETLLQREPASGARAWLPIAVFEGQAWLGPVLGQRSGPCPQCLRDRLWHNHPIERSLLARGVSRDTLFPSPSPALAELDRALFWAQRRLPWMPSEVGSGPATLLTTHLRSGRESQHAVHARPQCPRCGAPDSMRRQMLEPPSWGMPEASGRTETRSSSAPIVSRDGGLRTIDPEATYQRLARQIDPLVGRVGSLGQALEKSNAHHQVFTAAYHRCRRPGEARAVQDFSVISGGKGRSPVQSRTSALCEALERQCAQFEGDEARLSGSYESLAPDAIDPRTLLLFSDAQYRAGTPERLRRYSSPRSQQVPAPFEVTQNMDWSPVWSLAQRRLRWLPTAYCFDGAPSPEPVLSCAWDSNGCASGNTLAEATLQGLLELVERDAVAIWWYNQLPMPGLSLEQSLSPTARLLVNRHERAGRRCWALDLTHDLGIPVVAALLEDMESGAIALGFGCHPSVEIAVERAVLELEQVQGVTLFNRAELADERQLLPTAGRAPVPRADFSAALGEAELDGTLAMCVKRLCAAGLDPLLLDYSRPDVALYSVKVLVPGLRHFWPRYAPGRLYEVPVRMGWLAARRAEAELNPLPLLM